MHHSEVSDESAHLLRIMLMIAVALTGPASAAKIAIPSVVTIAITVAGIVPVPHFVVSTSADRRSGLTRADRFAEYEERRKSRATNRWVASVSVGRCRISCSVPQVGSDPAVWLRAGIGVTRKATNDDARPNQRCKGRSGPARLRIRTMVRGRLCKMDRAGNKQATIRTLAPCPCGD